MLGMHFRPTLRYLMLKRSRGALTFDLRLRADDRSFRVHVSRITVARLSLPNTCSTFAQPNQLGTIELHWQVDLPTAHDTAAAAADDDDDTVEPLVGVPTTELRSFVGEFGRSIDMRAAELMLVHYLGAKAEILCSWNEASQSYESSRCTIQ